MKIVLPGHPREIANKKDLNEIQHNPREVTHFEEMLLEETLEEELISEEAVTDALQEEKESLDSVEEIEFEKRIEDDYLGDEDNLEEVRIQAKDEEKNNEEHKNEQEQEQQQGQQQKDQEESEQEFIDEEFLEEELQEVIEYNWKLFAALSGKKTKEIIEEKLPVKGEPKLKSNMEPDYDPDLITVEAKNASDNHQRDQQYDQKQEQEHSEKKQ